MIQVSYRELLEAGTHFGHRISRWNPNMRPYIFGKRNGIHILDIRETLKGMIRASHAVLKMSAGGGDIIFVGTKRQSKALVEQHALRCGMPYVTERWLGGTLTNFETIRRRIKRLDEIEGSERDGSIRKNSKKIISALTREKRKMVRNLQGLRHMKSLPAGIIIVDPRREENCVKEARRLGVVTIGFLDTDCDPGDVDFAIPGNDDAMKSVGIVLKILADAVLEGRRVGGRGIDAGEPAPAAAVAAE